MGEHAYYVECLKQDLEKAVRRPIHTSSDFDFLYIRLKSVEPYAPSVSTLKRLWSYVSSPSKRSASTLNTLSRFLGYSDWNSYVEHLIRESRVESGFLSTKSIISENLHAGDKIEVTWAPDRKMLMEHLTDRRFRVLACENGRLPVGARFSALAFTIGLPLLCTDVEAPEGTPLGVYTAGSRSGLLSLDFKPAQNGK